MEALVDYTAGHLQREEQPMASVNFPNLERHKIGHSKLIDSLHELQNKYDGGSLTVMLPLSAVLQDGLLLQIRRSDKELLMILKKKTCKEVASVNVYRAASS
jgi:hemerythrin-like metal-binding protein